MDLGNYRKVIIWVMLVFFALACASSVFATPAATPMLEADARQTLEAVIARTAAAAQTQTATLIPPTYTPTITNTPTKMPTRPIPPSPTFQYSSLPTYSLPPTITNTPDPLAVPLNPVGSSGGGDSSKKAPPSCIQSCVEKAGPGQCNDFCMSNCQKSCQWRCNVRSSPNLVIAPGKKFVATWVVANIGIATWYTHTIDFVYKGGLKDEGKTIHDLPGTVPYGGTIEVGGRFTAPKKEGEYSAYYMIKVDATEKTEFCPMWLTLLVRN
jgi:hypothetical protein